MKRFYLLLLVIFNVLLAVELPAQMTMYYMDRLPQSQQFNPAIVPKVGFFLELPGVGNGQVEFNNSGFNLGEFIDFSDNIGSPGYNPDAFVKSIGEFNTTNLETRVNIFSMGFKLKKKGYFTIGLSQRNFLDLTAPSKIIYLFQDNEKIRERLPIQIDGINLRLNTFSQLSVTYSKTINNKLTIGVAPKLIGAIGGISSEELSLELKEVSFGEFEQKYNGKVQLGLPVSINPEAITSTGELDTNEDLLASDWDNNISTRNLFQNASLAFDIGVNYNLNKDWSFSASLLDLGKSSWKRYGYDLAYNGDVAQVKELSQFKMKIPTKLILGANYKLSSDWNTGLLFRNVSYDSGNFSSTTLSLNGYIGSMLSTSFSYTAGHGSDNLGFGLRLRFFPGIDLYAVTDNVLNAFEYRNIQYSSVAFGVNFAFGVRNRYNQEVVSD